MLRRLISLLCVIGAFAAFAGAATAAKLAYETGGAKTTVWLAGATGKGGKKLGPGTSPLLSPNGKSVAATLFGPKGPGLAIYVPGATTQKYFNNANAVVSAVAWSPDSRYLAVSLSSTKASGKGSGLAVVDTSNGTVKTLVNSSTCGASFAPSGSARLVYAASKGTSQCFTSKVNLFTVNVDGTGTKQITTDGRSLNPVWGPKSIVFDTETLRKNDAPIYQLVTMRPDGSHRVQITHMKIPKLVSGLSPLQISANGKHVLADYGGQDTSETWVVNLPTRKAKQLKVGGQSVVPAALSKAGSAVLVAVGALDTAPKNGAVESIPFRGGKPTVLVKHAANPSWNK
jgi:Tol biopolymer transport system component